MLWQINILGMRHEPGQTPFGNFQSSFVFIQLAGEVRSDKPGENERSPFAKWMIMKSSFLGLIFKCLPKRPTKMSFEFQEANLNFQISE